jgi:hypothetical protein
MLCFAVENLECMTHGEFAVSMLYVIMVPHAGVTSQGWRLRQLMLFFLNNRTKISSQNKLQNSSLGNFNHISSVSSYYSLMLQNNVTCMMKLVEILLVKIWTYN